MHYSFCPDCGKQLIKKQAGDDGLIPYCNNCNKYWFDTFSSCVIVLVANEFNEIALLKQSYLSDTYMTFVAGYMTPGENAETAARREVKEELGITLDSLDLICTHWFNPKGLLMIGFIAKTKKCIFRLSSEVDSANWVHYTTVPDYLFPDNADNAAFVLYREYLKLLEKSTL